MGCDRPGSSVSVKSRAGVGGRCLARITHLWETPEHSAHSHSMWLKCYIPLQPLGWAPEMSVEEEGAPWLSPEVFSYREGRPTRLCQAGHG